MSAASIAPPLAASAGPVRKRVHLWLPLSLLWLLLAPFVLLVSPIVALVALAWRINGFVALGTLGGFLFALSGTHIRVEAPRASINIHIL